MQTKLIIFDCDGTLVDSETISMEVMIEFAADLGACYTHEEAMRRFAGMDLKLVIQDIESRIDGTAPDDFIPQFRTRQFSALRERLAVIDGAHELLSSLSQLSCVASNAPLEKVRICLETTGLLDHFSTETLFSAYQVDAWKPNPKLFLEASKQMGAANNECIVVEDSIYGIDAGLAAGMRVIALDRHGDLEPQMSGARQSVHLIKHLSEVSTLID